MQCYIVYLSRGSWLEFELEMAGAMVAHSILQGGPGLPCLHPAVFHTMVSGEAQLAVTTLTENELPTAKDIPLNASTCDLLEMIDQVCTIVVTFSQAYCIITITFFLLQLDHASTVDEINTVIDDPRYAGILNSCGWPTTKCITATSKTEFLQCLVHNEVIHKRLGAIQAFCQGLEHLNVVTLLRQNVDVMKPVFLCQKESLTPEAFLSLISTPKPNNETKGLVYDWFVEYIRSTSKEATLEQVLQFCTGLKRIPPMGLKDRITIKFLCNCPLPMAEACFAIIQLPTIHTDKETFFNKLDQGVLYSINHFGQV